MLKLLALVPLYVFLFSTQVQAAKEKCAGDEFDGEVYLARYKDLRDAGLKLKNACKHYKIIGKLEGRSGAPDVSSSTTGSSGGGAVNCSEGPEINLISDVSSTRLSARFNGVNVTGIDYSILNSSGGSVASGSFSPSSNTQTLSFSALPGGNYTLKYSANNCVGSSSKTFKVEGPVVVVPLLPACKAGPEIKTISEVSTGSLNALFHGEEVYGIDYSILNASSMAVASGSFAPTSNNPKISYSNLSPGKYTLVFKGNKCEGGSQQGFTIPGTVVVDPGLPACKAGPTIQTISSITTTSLSAIFNGVEVYGIDYSILNSSGTSVASGSFAPANNTPKITYSALAAGSYTLVFKGNKCEGGSQKAFTVAGPVVVDPGLPACKAGPTIQTISDITSTSLSAIFNGVEVYGIDYSILNSSGTSVASGSFAPANNTPKISYSALAAGSYTLVFKGNKCEGGSQKAFTVAGTVVVPLPEDLPGCKAGPEIKAITDITSTSLKAQFHGEEIYGIDYTILNSSNKGVASGSFVPQNSTPVITFSSLAAGDYSLVFRGNKCEGGSQKSFSIQRLDLACISALNLTQISNISSTSLRAAYSAASITGITYSIKNSSGSVVSTGSFTPSSTTTDLSFSELSSGNYTLSFEANNCKSSSLRTFSVEALPVDPVPTGDWTPMIVAQGHPKHFQLALSGSSKNWVLNDTSSQGLSDGYEFRYMIGSEIIKQRTPLKNYLYQSNNPLRILKLMTKIGLDTVNRWENGGTGYYDGNAAQTFSHNVSVAFATVIFKGPAEASFNNIIPANFQLTRHTNWADSAPDMTLPKGHFWVAKKGDWTYQQIMKKGVTHISNYDLPWDVDGNRPLIAMRDQGITYNDVPRIESIFNLQKVCDSNQWVDGYDKCWWPNGPLNEQEAIDKANRTDISHALWIGETMEGGSYMPYSNTMFKHFYKRLMERYQERFGSRGIPFLIAHNYFMFWPGEFSLGSGDRDAKKKLFTVPLSEIPHTEFSPEGNLSSTNLIVEAVYLGPPDIQQGSVYNTIYRMELQKRMGYTSGVFLFAVHEWRPNNMYRYDYPEGQFYVYDKIPLDPSVHTTYAFIAQVFGKLFVEWGAGGKQVGTDMGTDSGGLWFPNGSDGSQDGFPHYFNPNTSSGSKYGGYNGGPELSYFGTKLYNETFGQVDGGDRKYLKFRIDGGAWVSPSEISGHNIVDAQYDSRGFVFSESKNGKTAWFYLNSYADNRSHKLEVVLPSGATVTETVAGNGIHAKIQ